MSTMTSPDVLAGMELPENPAGRKRSRLRRMFLANLWREKGGLSLAALFMLGRLFLRMETDEDFLRTARVLKEGFPNTKEADAIGYLMGHFYRNRRRVT